MANHHELKTWAQYFEAVWSGRKTFEVRRNDRDFKQGDFLFLRETVPATDEYTGRMALAQVMYVVVGAAGVEANYAVMSIRVHAKLEDWPPGPS